MLWPAFLHPIELPEGLQGDLVDKYSCETAVQKYNLQLFYQHTRGP
jgi:hypothetical protein